ncbi:hypothetical protein [Methylocystis sp. ATCC 49242]|uniref:hypothetical protein n=1 Tax=Methylocystis sp. ATCC 49242 TaxID=622637 RepID=UPI0011854DEB|nr:hypothetical protein [Methylocystis sp. ATCC 49242]
MQIEALGLDYWKAAKARDGIVSLARLISKQETVLRAAKEAKAAEPQKPQTLADFLANRPKAAVDA